MKNIRGTIVALALLMVLVVAGVLIHIRQASLSPSSVATPGSQPAPNGGPTPADKQKSMAFFGELVKHENGTFIFNGTVVDQNGAPIKDVDVFIEKSRHTGWGDFVHENQHVLISDTFSFKWSGYRNVGLSFTKTGYYSTGGSYHLVLPGEVMTVPNGEDVAGGNEPGVFRKDGMRVVLETTGSMPDLLRAYFRHNTVGTQSRPLIIGGQAVDDRYDTKYQLSIDESPSNESTHEDEILIWATVDAAGHFQTMTLPQLGDPQLIPVELPQEVHLRYRGGDGGFQKCLNSGITGSFRTMRDAPEAGYTTELVLGPEDWKTMSGVTQGGKGVFAYLKMRDRYGKCRIGTYSEKGMVYISIEMYVQRTQTDGRNVRTY